MDLGIVGKQALVCAESKGLGFACAASSGYIPGQNIVIDGGVHAGRF